MIVNHFASITFSLLFLCTLAISVAGANDYRLVYHNPEIKDGIGTGRHVVFLAGDHEYRSEESMPALARILARHHGFKCTVLFNIDKETGYIDPGNNNMPGTDVLEDADLMVVFLRFQNFPKQQMQPIVDYLDRGGPVVGLRTSTHAFKIPVDSEFARFDTDYKGEDYKLGFGRQVLGETWAGHYGTNHVMSTRLDVTEEGKKHPVMLGVSNPWAQSGGYWTKPMPNSIVLANAQPLENMKKDGKPAKNKEACPGVWVRTYKSKSGKAGRVFTTTYGASEDFLDDDFRRMMVNGCSWATGLEGKIKPDLKIDFVGPFNPTTFSNLAYRLGVKPEDLAGWDSPIMSKDNPSQKKVPWGKPRPKQKLLEKKKDDRTSFRFEFRNNERVALVGGSLAERMNLFGHLETKLHSRFFDKKLVVRNFGWPADEVGKQQRPDNYTRIDDPLEVFAPETFICFFGFNEHYAGDSREALTSFKQKYSGWIDQHQKKFNKPGRETQFVLVSPIAFEQTNNPLLPDGESNNITLEKYASQIQQLAEERNLPFIDLLTPTKDKFAAVPASQFTINGIHVNDRGDQLLASEIEKQLFGKASTRNPNFEKIRTAVNDKSWFHLQDYRMLNGWYVYGGRRTWDKETFPGEYGKIRKMVAVRDQYVWDIASGKDVPARPDDSNTGEVFIPETMFGTRDDNFKQFREPKTLEYPSPEDSISQMSVPEGLEVQLFASEREFPELANPTQMAFDGKGRLWVSCMVNYPQWLPGSAKPGDKLLIFEDTNNDGKADVCKTFYDRLICPTGFEFHEDGVLVVDEPRIIFLRDIDGDDVADEMTQVIDGIATDDTHHAMGAWEWSHGGLLHMQEGISMSTTMETPWGPFRNKGPSGSYVLDPKSWRFRYFKTPGYGNPWCLVFDRWGMGVIGDGTNARQHWTSPLSGFLVGPRRTLQANFDNEGMRPAVGSEFLYSRHFPDEFQGQFTYSCVINMHGMPRFEVGDEDGTAGYAGKRIEDLLSSTDNFFRPVDAKIGPDGALWFGDWCNALIGHMQYSQRDPNRDHQHGRIYRLVNKNKPLLKPDLQAGKSIEQLLEQLLVHELRTRYRARREIRARDQGEVFNTINNWIAKNATDEQLCEAMWIQESFRKLDPALVERILASDDFHARSAVVHSVTNEFLRFDGALDVFKRAIKDDHPRVRLEALRGLSFVRSLEAAEVALQVLDKPMDYWLSYTLEHTLHAIKPFVDDSSSLVNSNETAKSHFADFLLSSGPGGAAVIPLRDAHDADAPKWKRDEAVRTLAKIRGGNAKNGMVVYDRTCSSCHQIGDKGKAFGPALDGIAAKYTKREIISHILFPNEKIAEGYETVQVLTIDGQVLNGFVLEETDDTLSLGVATDDGKGKRADILKEDIDERKAMKASSMPEGLVQTIAPSEFLDLVACLGKLTTDKDGWIATGQPSQGELRQHGRLVEVSRNAKIKLGWDYGLRHNRYANLALSAADAKSREFAFHSPDPPIENPAVIVRLDKPMKVRHVELHNRRGSLHERAKNLAVWASTDLKSWERVWKATEVKPKYSIDIRSDRDLQFIKVGLEGKGILHLNQIVVFGDE